eukprot:29977-Pelagococcus_subviridis.AAC.2
MITSRLVRLPTVILFPRRRVHPRVRVLVLELLPRRRVPRPPGPARVVRPAAARQRGVLVIRVSVSPASPRAAAEPPPRRPRPDAAVLGEVPVAVRRALRVRERFDGAVAAEVAPLENHADESSAAGAVRASGALFERRRDVHRHALVREERAGAERVRLRGPAAVRALARRRVDAVYHDESLRSGSSPMKSRRRVAADDGRERAVREVERRVPVARVHAGG